MTWLLAAIVSIGLAQPSNPVFPDDSTRARDVLRSLSDRIDAGNTSEAVRSLQGLLGTESDRVLETEDEHLFRSVRWHVHRTLLERPDLLERYREMMEPVASTRLAEGNHVLVEQAYLLTPSGYEAALRLAQTHLEGARFEAARLTLLQLGSHPDRDADAGRLLRLVARYLDDESLHATGVAWSEEGRPFEASPTPPGASETSIDPSTPQEPIDLGAMVPTPLKSVDLTIGTLIDANQISGGGSWVMPTVVGDRVFVNDGETISSFDRFTLAERWRWTPPGDVVERRQTQAMVGRRARNLEDSSTVAVAGDVVVATTGLAFQGGREGDPRTHALDRWTGRHLWSVSVEHMDARLEYGVVHGPALVSEDTVVLGVRKFVQSRRLNGTFLVGLDLHTGAPRWIRLIGSSGALPHRGAGRVADAGIVHRGIVYRSDESGVIAAVEATSGRPVWVRRSRSLALYSPDSSDPWSSQAPLIHEGRLIVIAPDREEIVAVDLSSGDVLQRMPAHRLGNPRYLLPLGERLIAVSSRLITSCPIDMLAPDAPVSIVQQFDDQREGVVGRVAIGGDRLLVPLREALGVVDPETPRQMGRVELGHGGNIIATASQLLVVDSRQMHGYLVWEIASEMLRSRMESNPDDPQPALTFAELAYRAGQSDQIVGAIDKALGAIERNPDSASSIAARPQVFHALRRMVETSQSQWFDDGASNPSTPDAAPESISREDQIGPTPLIRDLELLDALCERMGIAASTTDHRVSSLMALGRLREAQHRHASGVEAYQRILEDATLAQSTWYGPELAVRADLEATRRLETLVQREGASCYRVYDTLATAETSLERTRSASSWEDLAKRYPVASSAPTAWLRAAEAYDDSNQPTMALRALRAGLHASEVAAMSGRGTSSLSMVAGALYDALRDRGLDGQALRHLATMRESYPTLQLLVGGVAFDRDAAIRDLEQRYAQRHRRATIGPILGTEPQSLPGWSIVDPIDGEGRSTSHIMLLSTGRSEIACFTGTPLRKTWSRPYASHRPAVHRIDEHAAWLVWRTSDGASIERVDVKTGETAWKTEAFRSLFPSDDQFARNLRDALGAPRQMESPIDGVVDVTSILISSDDETIALVERSGRACAIDVRTGEVIWREVTPIRQVHDVDSRGGVLVIGGATEASTPFRPSLIAYDLRTGEAMHRMHDLQSQVRWVRLAPGGDLIAGFDHGITSLQLVSGRLNWSLTDEAGILTRNSWMYGDHLFLLDSRQDVWLASVSTGRVRDQRLDARRRLDSGDIRSASLGDRTVFTSTRGVAIFGDGGDLVGLDAINTTAPLIPGVIAQGAVVTIETSERRAPGGVSSYALHIVDTLSCKRLAGTHLDTRGRAPRRLALLDDRVLVTAGNVTIVLEAGHAED